MKKKTWIIIISSVLVLSCVVGYLGVNFYAYQQMTRIRPWCRGANLPTNFQSTSSRWPDFDPTPYFMQNYEDVHLTSRDDQIALTAWFVPAPGTPDISTAPTVIVVPGLNNCRRVGSVLTRAGMLNRHGFNALVLNLRNHGDSAQDTGTHAAGTKESKDVLGAWDWLVTEKRIPKEKIGVFGSSFGGRSILNAMAQEPEIAAGAADGILVFEEAVRLEFQKRGIPQFFLPGAFWVGKMLTGYNMREELASKIGTRPFLLFHGTEDQRVPIESAQNVAEIIKASGGNPVFWAVPKAGHGEPVYKATDEYELKIVDFFARALKS